MKQWISSMSQEFQSSELTSRNITPLDVDQSHSITHLTQFPTKSSEQRLQRLELHLWQQLCFETCDPEKM